MKTDQQKQNNHTSTSNIKVAFFLNSSFIILELIGGIFTNSVAIISDALHDLGDSLSLGLAWYFQKLSGKARDKNYSFGYKRFSLLGAVINSLVLIVGSIFILNETIPRLFRPEVPNAHGMLILALFGVIVNGAAVFRLKKGSSINEKVISLHLLEDVLGWGAVLIASLIMIFIYLPILDPVLSVIITFFVLFNIFKNLKISFRIFLQAVPNDTNIELIKGKILNIPGVSSIHDIHIWTLDGEYNILTVHLVVKDVDNLLEIKNIKEQVKSLLKDLKLQHITIEVEIEDENCDLKNCGD